MNEAIMYGMYGAAIMILISTIKMFVKGKIDIMMIPNSIFGFVAGGIGYWIISSIMLEIYPEFPILAIICICLFGLGILGTTLSIIFRGEK